MTFGGLHIFQARVVNHMIYHITSIIEQAKAECQQSAKSKTIDNRVLRVLTGIAVAQCEFPADEKATKRDSAPKDPREIPSDSLANPEEPPRV